MDAVTMETVAGRIPACEHTNFPPIRGNANLSNLLSSPLLSAVSFPILHPNPLEECRPINLEGGERSLASPPSPPPPPSL